jgi:tetratricopeptide (TPR) repeat protein
MIRSFVRGVRPHAPILPLLLALALPAATPAVAQIPEEYTNLEVLPQDITRERLSAIMRGFTEALDVRCSTCHVGEEGLPLETYDFAADDKATKLKAREMLRMVQAINGEYLANLPQRREPNVEVSCATCHRGVSRPEPIELVIENTMTNEDLDFAVERYRELREQYYGSAAYDFTDGPLAGLAQRLAANDATAAKRILELNLEFNPESVRSFDLLGAIAEREGDNAAAIEYYRKALAIDPEDRRAQQRLQALGGGGA